MSEAQNNHVGEVVRGSKIGVVESDSRAQTRKVVVRYKAKHPKYGKYVSRRTVLHVHDPENESTIGDRVEVAPCRPISKTKSWRLVRVVEKGDALDVTGVTAQAAAQVAEETGE